LILAILDGEPTALHIAVSNKRYSEAGERRKGRKEE